MDKDIQKSRPGILQWLTESSDRVRNILALIAVGGFVLGLGIAALVIPMTQDNGIESAVGFIKDVSSIFNGLIGMIVGYYFGKS